MAEELITEDIVEIIDTGKKFDKALTHYSDHGWKLMYYSSVLFKDGKYYQAVVSKNEEAFFKEFGEFKELFK